MIIRNANKDRFTVIDNKLLEDSRLTWEARGVLSYLLSKPDGWVIRPAHLRAAGNAGKDKLQRIFRELKALGYLEYAKGGFEKSGTTITLVEAPKPREPEKAALDAIGQAESLKTRLLGNPTLGKHGSIVNTETAVITETTENIQKPVRLGQGIRPPEGLNVEAWTKLETYRSQVLKKPYKTDLKMKEMATYPHEIQQQAIDETIAQEWSGCFPAKLMAKGGQQGAPGPMCWDRIIEDLEQGQFNRANYSAAEIKALNKVGGSGEIGRTHYSRLKHLKNRFLDAHKTVHAEH
jgi:hypothetical protein